MFTKITNISSCTAEKEEIIINNGLMTLFRVIFVYLLIANGFIMSIFHGRNASITLDN